MTMPHILIQMLGLSSPWEAQDVRNVGCTVAGCKYDFTGVLLLYPGIPDIQFVEDGYILYHTSWWEDSAMVATVQASLERLGIELVDVVGSDPCPEGAHEYWSWQRKVGGA